MSLNVTIVLSGCGALDGSSAQETILLQAALAKAGATIVFAAPDLTQKEIINHHTGDIMEREQRNTLIESARLVDSGNVCSLENLDVEAFDAFIFPGGVGTIHNLCYCDPADTGHFHVEPSVKKLITTAHTFGKTLGFISHSALLASVLLGWHEIKITIGDDPHLIGIIRSMGTHHLTCTAEEVIEDEVHHILSTPAQLLTCDITVIEKSVYRLVNKALKK